MSFQVERRAIERRFQLVFGASNPSIPVVYENRVFKRPDAHTAWVAFFILRGAESQQLDICIDNETTRSFGIVHIVCYAPEQKGVDAAMSLADKVAKVFNNVQFLGSDGSDITFFAATLRNVGNRDGKWMCVIQINFQHDTNAKAGVGIGPPYYFLHGTEDSSNKDFNIDVDVTDATFFQVFRNGLLLNPVTDYSVAGNTVLLTDAPKPGDNLIGFMSKAQYDIPTGLKNGVNLIFTLAAIPVPAEMELFYNGELLDPTSDYSVVGATITLVLAPSVGDNLVAYY